MVSVSGIAATAQHRQLIGAYKHKEAEGTPQLLQCFGGVLLPETGACFPSSVGLLLGSIQTEMAMGVELLLTSMELVLLMRDGTKASTCSFSKRLCLSGRLGIISLAVDFIFFFFKFHLSYFQLIFFIVFSFCAEKKKDIIFWVYIGFVCFCLLQLPWNIFGLNYNKRSHQNFGEIPFQEVRKEFFLPDCRLGPDFQ